MPLQCRHNSSMLSLITGNSIQKLVQVDIIKISQLWITDHLCRGRWVIGEMPTQKADNTQQATGLYLYQRWSSLLTHHDDVIKWKHFPRYWPFVRGIHRPPVNSQHKGQRRGALMFYLISVLINGWENNREAGALRRYRAHNDVTVMYLRIILVGPYHRHTTPQNIIWPVYCI